MKQQQAKQIVKELMWTRYFLGEVWIEPTVFDYVSDSEIEQAILQNWLGIYMGARHKEVLHSDHYSELGFEFQIRTWIPNLYTEVFPIC